MDSVLPPILLATAGLLAIYVCVRTILRILPHAIQRAMRQLRESVDEELALRKLPHGRHHLADTKRSMATKRQLLDRLYTHWHTRTGNAPVVPDHGTAPEWRRLISRLDEVDQELTRQDELTRERYREETEQAIAGFDRSVRRLWWLIGTDLALFLTSGAVVLWVVTALTGW